MSSDSYSREFRARMKMVEMVAAQAGAKIVDVKILCLVDLQGIYLGLQRFFEKINFPIEGGSVMGKFAALQVNEMFSRIPAHFAKRCGPNVGMVGELMKQAVVEERGGRLYPASDISIEPGKHYLRVIPKFEIFYAQPPLDKIEWNLRKFAKAGNRAAISQLDAIKNGVLQRGLLFSRDYSYYQEFVDAIKLDASFNAEHKGFFSFRVSERGLDYFDEKEVDSRICIRAMQSLYEKESDVLCVISSDQDFLPLQEVCKKFDVQFFLADLAKFTSDDRVGRRLVEMEDAFLPGLFHPSWPLDIVSEALVSPGLVPESDCLVLTVNEALALAALHNSINDFHINININEDKVVGLSVSKPSESNIELRKSNVMGITQAAIEPLVY